MNSTKENKIPINPSRTCDVVMKGGVTSGIVYPKAIYELSQEYKFVNIGGTSAGAIAAALTAAAEYNRRETGSSEGFEKLLKLPQLLTQDVEGSSKLFSLFKPNKSTRKLFYALMNIYKQKSCWKKIASSLSALIFGFPLITIVSLLPSVFVIIGLNGKIESSGLYFWYSFFIGLFNFIFTLVLNAVYYIFSSKKLLEDNHYGLTTGNLTEEDVGEKKDIPDSLTPWLSNLINKVAGRGDVARPLTFGDLKNCSSDSEPINLQMVSTNLTWRRPHTLPFDNKQFYFDPKELMQFFPKNVVSWMVSKSKIQKRRKFALTGAKDLFSLPEADDLPVIFATRLSLSFPVLFSTVPLYAVDYKLEENQSDRKNAFAEKCYFSDGGICSNFPVHFFDCPLPGRPTFAFNLDKYPEDGESPGTYKDISAPSDNNSGINPTWFRFENSFMSFIKSILGTMQNWQDNTQLTVPGFRDRIVSIHLSDKEGGLNLNMDKDTIIDISNRGELAGSVIRDRFTGKVEHKLNWDNHRWIRFRNTFCLLEDYLKKIEDGLNSSSSEFQQSYIELLEREKKDPPLSYRFEESHRKSATEKIKKLREFITYLKSDKKSFCTGAPKPTPEIKVKPKI